MEMQGVENTYGGAGHPAWNQITHREGKMSAKSEHDKGAAKKTGKVYHLVAVLCRDYFVEAASSEEALKKHADGESVFNSDDDGYVHAVLQKADGPGEVKVAGEPVELTDRDELSYARKLIREGKRRGVRRIENFGSI
jgi:hypothetical protein